MLYTTLASLSGALWRIRRAKEANLLPKPSLKADKDKGIIVLDTETQLTGVPPEAWSYKLGNRSALEWILDQYKEKTPTSSRPDANRLSSFTEFQRTPCALASSHGRYFLTLSPHERFPRREGRPIGLAVVTGFEILWAYPRSAARPYRNKQGGRWPSVSTDIPWSERSHLRILSLIRQ